MANDDAGFEVSDPAVVDVDDAGGPGVGTDSAAGSDEVDLVWARRQRSMAVVGSVLAVVAFGCTILSLIGYPKDLGAPSWQLYLAIVAAGVLALCCVVLIVGWLQALRSWGSSDRTDLSGWMKWCFAAHLLSYLAVLFAMYATVAESALVGWNSGTGTFLGLAFIVVIAAQTIAGTQYLRHRGPPGTVPNYLRLLNDKVQSLR